MGSPRRPAAAPTHGAERPDPVQIAGNGAPQPPTASSSEGPRARKAASPPRRFSTRRWRSSRTTVRRTTPRRGEEPGRFLHLDPQGEQQRQFSPAAARERVLDQITAIARPGRLVSFRSQVGPDRDRGLEHASAGTMPRATLVGPPRRRVALGSSDQADNVNQIIRDFGRRLRAIITSRVSLGRWRHLQPHGHCNADFDTGETTDSIENSPAH